MDAPRVVAIGILTAGSRVLVTRRQVDSPLAGLWEFPGGKVEFGEHPWEALRRELREELSLSVSRGELFGIYSHVYDFGGTKVHYVLVAYRIRIPRSKIAATADRSWVPARDLTKWPVVPGSVQIVRDLVPELT